MDNNKDNDIVIEEVVSNEQQDQQQQQQSSSTSNFSNYNNNQNINVIPLTQQEVSELNASDYDSTSSTSDTNNNANNNNNNNRISLCKHKGPCIMNALTSWARSFVIGYGLRASLAFVTGLLMRRLYRNPKKLINQSFLHKDPIGFGLFLGFYTGGYKAIGCLLRLIRKKDDGINSAIAGFLSGSAMMFSKSTELALYLLAASFETIFNAICKRGYLRPWKHGDTALFSICTMILFYAFVWEPKTVRPSYLGFLSKVAGKNRDLTAVTGAIREAYYQQQKLLTGK
eukprot:gene10358-12721_t